MVPRRKILVTGATGFVGKNLVRELHKKSENVTCLVRSTGKAASLKNLGAKLVEGDITNYDRIKPAFQNIDIVIHLAAVIDSSSKKLFEDVNVSGTQNCIKAALSNKVKKFIYISSLDAKYFKGSYSKSKVEAEKIVKESGLDFVILRPSFIYGRNSPYFKKLVDLVKNYPITPVIGNGKQRLQPVHVNDVVSLLAKAVNSSKAVGKTYYVAGSERISFDNMLTLISEKLGKKKTKIYLPASLVKFIAYILEKLSKKSHITVDRLDLLLSDKTCDISKTAKDFNFNPMKFEKGLELSLK